MDGVVANRSQESGSVQLRHHHVGQHQSRTRLARGVERLIAIRNRMHLVSVVEQVPEVVAHVGVVVGQMISYVFRSGRPR